MARDLTRQRALKAPPPPPERLFRALTEHSADAISVLDGRGTIRYANREFCRVFGYRPGEPVGLWAFDLIHPDDLPAIVAQFEELVRMPEAVARTEYRVRHAGGTWSTRSTIAQNLLTDSAVAGIVVHSRDVTERRRAQATLRASEARFRTLCDSSPVGVFETDRAGNVTYVNSRLAEMWGAAGARELIGEGWLARVHPDDRGRLRRAWAKAVLEVRELTCEYRVLLPDGRVLHARGHATPLRGADGGFVGTVGTVLDVTAQRRAHDSQQLLLRAATDFATTFDLGEILDRVARAAVPFLGDSCAVYLAGPGGRLSRATLTPPSDDEETRLRLLAERFPAAPRSDAALAAAAIRTGAPAVEFDAGGDAAAGSAALPRARMAVPFVAHGRVSGALCLHATDARRPYDDVELEAAQDLAARAALAIQSARLFRQLRTARRKAEALGAEQRALIEAMRDVIFVLDADGRYVKIPQTTSELLARPVGELLGKRLHDVMPTDLADGLLATVRRALETRGAVRTEYALTIGDRTVSFAAVVSPLTDDRVVWVARDVTEKRRAAEALRKNERRYRLLFERHALPMYVCDAETGRVLAVNDAALAKYGFSRDEFLAMGVDDLAPTDGRGGEAARAWETEPPATARHARKDGSRIDVELVSDDVVFGERPARLVLANDVTERVHVVAALGEARRHVELLLASAGEGIYALDAARRVTFVNPAAARLFGASPDKLLGRELCALVVRAPLGRAAADSPPDARTTCPIAATLGDGTVHRVDTDHFRREDGTAFPVEYVSTPIREDGAIVGAVVAFQDISQRKQLELQLVQAQKMEAVGRLAGGVAHDFNNLLTVITSYTDMLLAEIPPDDPMHADLREVQGAAGRAAGLTRQLLAFSRQQVLSPRVVDIRHVVGEMERMLSRLIGEDIALTLCGDGGPTHVLADPGQLEQVVMNLAVNARDAMPLGGRLEIEIAGATLTEADRESRPYVVPGEYACLRVRDTGGGMDERTLSRVFEPFFTTKELGKGTGLGLATVYGIVKQSGGYVWAESAPGAGTTFEVYLPRAAAAAAAAPGAAAPGPVPARRQATVLLVEDEDAVRAVAERALRRHGFTVLSAEGGAAALAVAARHDGPIDLLVTDVVMPEMSGQELADRLARLRPDTPVLFVSGYSMDAVTTHGVLRPGGRLLAKPYLPTDLARAAGDALRPRDGAADRA